LYNNYSHRLDKCRQDFVQQLLTLIGQNIDRLYTTITHTDWTNVDKTLYNNYSH